MSSIETESEAVETLKTTVSTTVSKIDELNKEYDFVSKGKQLASAAAVLSDTAFEKLDELNAKVCIIILVFCTCYNLIIQILPPNQYDFVKVAKETASKAVEKAKEIQK